MDSDLIKVIVCVAIVVISLVVDKVKKARERMRNSGGVRRAETQRPQARRPQAAPARTDMAAAREALPRLSALMEALGQPEAPAAPQTSTAPAQLRRPRRQPQAAQAPQTAQVGSEEGQRVTTDTPVAEPVRTAPALEPPTLAELRRAVVWSEILKPKFEQ